MHTPTEIQTRQALRLETEGKSTLIGFVGAPWTLAAYSIEGGSSKYALHTKKMMMEDPALFHTLMTKLANSIGDYACYQVNGSTDGVAREGAAKPFLLLFLAV